MKAYEIVKEENVGKKYLQNGWKHEVVKDSNVFRLMCIDRQIGYGKYVELNNITMDFEYEEIKPLTGWERVKEGKHYYLESLDGTITPLTETNNSFDKQQEENYNYFSTKEKAEEVAELTKACRRELKFRDENDVGKCDWKDLSDEKYYVAYNFETNRFKVKLNCTLKSNNVVYYSSKEIAQQYADILNSPFEN